MKEVIAIIRPAKARLTKQKLGEKGFWAYTETRVFGRGKQKGVQYLGNGEGTATFGIPFLPKRMLALVVNDEDLERAVEIFLEVNKTGEIGDGKIFISPVEDVIRIRTDERQRAALV